MCFREDRERTEMSQEIGFFLRNDALNNDLVGGVNWPLV